MTRTVPVPRVNLAPGYSISRLLKGGWQLAGGHGDVDRETAIDDMFRFVEAGITTFDCADIYTGVEELIGEFRCRYLERHGTSSADDIQVHTKFVPDLAALATFSRADAAAAVDRARSSGSASSGSTSCSSTGGTTTCPGYVEVAGWLDELRRAGKIRHLGVTNFDTAALRAILDAGIPITSIQVQYSLLDRRPPNGMAELCRCPGHSACSATGRWRAASCLRATLGAPAPGEPLENRSLVKYRLIIEEFGGWPLFQELLGVLASVARKHGGGRRHGGAAPGCSRNRRSRLSSSARAAPRTSTTPCAPRPSCSTARITPRSPAVLGERPPLPGDVYDLEREKGGRHAAIMRYDLNSQAGTGTRDPGLGKSDTLTGGAADAG